MSVSMSDHYVMLLEKVVEENKALREQVTAIVNKDKTALEDDLHKKIDCLKTTSKRDLLGGEGAGQQMAVGHSQNSSSKSREIQTEYCLTEALVKYKGYLECHGDETLKWWGDLGSLKAFVFALFGQDGKWSSPGCSGKAFRNKSVTITWYVNKRSLLVSGISGNTLRNRIVNQLKTGDLEESKANCSSNKGISTRDVGIQTDISLVNCSDKDGEFSANTCNMLSVDFEGLKLEVTILESRINGEICVNGNAIEQ
ncbi:Hypothetical predicted protein, partial [Paramuricea clavata]